MLIVGRNAIFSRCLATLAVLCACDVPTAVSQETGASTADQIDTLLSKAYPTRAPGAAVIVVDHDHVVLRKGFGLADVKRGAPVKPDDVFLIGSITKQFTAVALLQLVASGKIKLKDDIRTYVPELPASVEKIQLIHLLTHTSGLPNYTDEAGWESLDRFSLSQVIEVVKNRPAEFSPGTQWSYNNTGFRLLGAVIERVSGQDYATYIAENIFMPAGMTSSRYEADPGNHSRRIPGYSLSKNKVVEVAHSNAAGAHAAGGLSSTVDDLFKWEQSLAAGKLVSADLLADAYRSGRLSDGRDIHYGFGWSVGSVAGHSTVEHGGDIPGFSCHALRVPDAGLYIAVLCNSDKPTTRPEVVAEQIARTLLGQPLPSGVVSPEALQECAGVYRIGSLENLEIVAMENHLSLHRVDGSSADLITLSSAEFLNPNGGSHDMFPRNEAGQVDRMIYRPRVGPEKVQRRVNEPLVRPTITVASEVLDRYTGRYDVDGDALVIRRKDAILTARLGKEPEVTLLPESAVRFRAKEVVAWAEFKLDASNHTTGLVWSQGDEEVLARKSK